MRASVPRWAASPAMLVPFCVVMILLTSRCAASRVASNAEAPAPADSFPSVGYGPLVEDREGLLDLPPGFHYRLFSAAIAGKSDDPRFSQVLSDGTPVPSRHDGMGAFAGPGGVTILVRNHEVNLGQGPAVRGEKPYDPSGSGGTTTLWIDAEGNLIRSFTSLSGTIRNCAGGVTPWGTWLTAEECTYMPGERDGRNMDRTPEVTRPHGYMFEVDSRAEAAVDPVPIRAMGRFYHEAAAVDPATGFVYLTEDRWDGLLYRYRPTIVTSGERAPADLRTGDLQRGGTLEALRIVEMPGAPTSNWETRRFSPGVSWAVDWVDIPEIEPDMDMERVPREENSAFRSRAAPTSVRAQGAARGAAQFAFGEGIVAHDGAIDFACSKGGAKRAGQVWRLDPERQTLTLMAEPDDHSVLDGPDNMTVASNGDLLICEDGRNKDFVVGMTPDGHFYPFARNAWNDSELAGACFSSDGATLFINMQDPGITFAIGGPWKP